ncbi:hypothetical protein K443DRAFT_626163 [Laccaria amethystina LaAM-08-1]|uniref:Uncharacterized protein n=1 Tax=Laccaria amethystina LaAM-08-1 TaxID=1095629 RepID=A0A0C9XN58_9AGAR|nr:hypothetical protein K443DRAFT_626163 [Laccaria amethystina LaAM-08-1]
MPLGRHQHTGKSEVIKKETILENEFNVLTRRAFSKEMTTNEDNVSDKQRIWNPLKNKIICLIYVIEPGVSAIVNKDAIGRRSEISTNPENCEDKKPHLTGRKESRVSMLMKVENARICRSSIIGRLRFLLIKQEGEPVMT